MLTRKKAKKLTLEVWRYLRDHPEIQNKEHLPSFIYKKIKHLRLECPLCEILNCGVCPLKHCMMKNSGGFYINWVLADNIEARQQAAAKIVELVEAWDVL